MDRLEFQMLFVELGLAHVAGILPAGYVAIVLVVAKGLAVFLVFFAKVSPTRLLAVQSVDREELGELQIVGDATSELQVLIEFLSLAIDFEALPKAFA